MSVKIDIGFDPFAFIIAICAIWITLVEHIRGNKPCCSIIGCECSMKYDRHGERKEFRVLVRNQGISLHDPIMSLEFRDRGGLGWVRIQLERKDGRPGECSEFSRGMVAEFNLTSSGPDSTLTQFLANLDDPAKQEAQLVLYSQRYRATSFPVGGFRDRLAGQWNRHARRFNRMFEQRTGRVLKENKFLRDDFMDVESYLKAFRAMIKKGVEG